MKEMDELTKNLITSINNMLAKANLNMAIQPVTVEQPAAQPPVQPEAQPEAQPAVQTQPEDKAPSTTGDSTPADLSEAMVANELFEKMEQFNAKFADAKQKYEEFKKLHDILSRHIDDRDGFCKEAKGVVPVFKTSELRTFYSISRVVRKKLLMWKSDKPKASKKANKEVARILASDAVAPVDPTRVDPEQVAGIAEPATVNGNEAQPLPVAAIPTFNEQVQRLRSEAVSKAMDGNAAKIQGQVAQDATGQKNMTLVQLARAQARALGANGPVSIDEVTAALAATANVLPNSDKPHKWKGKIFNKSEWVCIGTKPTIMASSHARHVGLWALKTWLKSNTLNGTNAIVSSYNLFGIYKDMCKHNHTRIQTETDKFNWYIGDERLSPELRETIVKANNSLYGIPVSFIPGAVGAALLPPNPKNGVERTQ